MNIKKNKKCIAKHCENTKKKNSNLRFFEIPSKPEKRNLWLQALGLDLADKKLYHVCEKHFKKEHILEKKLSNIAVPYFVDDNFDYNITVEKMESLPQRDQNRKLIDTNEKIFKNSCRFCAEKSCKNLNIDNSWNESFFDVTEKLFSFTVEALNGFKICVNCVATIESICKFCNKVKNVSQILKILEKENLIHSSGSINNKYGSKKVYVIENSDERIGSEIIEIENNPISTKETVDRNSNKNIGQEIIEIEKQDIFDEFENNSNCSEIISKDLPIVSTIQFTEAENVNEINYSIGKPEKRTEERKTSLYKCQHCEKKYLTKVSVEYHIRKMHDNDKVKFESPVKCEICKKVYGCRQYLLQHQRKFHTISGQPKKIYKCEICGKMLTRFYILEAHKKLHLSAEERITSFFKCPHSELQYPSKRTMFNTEKLNLSAKSKCPHSPLFKCLNCKLQYPSKSTKLSHIRIQHNKEKLNLFAKNKCPHCDKRFSYKYILRSHIRSQHFKPVACKSCNQKFTNRPSLNLHRINEKCSSEWKCEICDKKISTKFSLKEHRKIHLTAEEREASSYKCPHCEKKYLRKESLRFHIRKIHYKTKSEHPVKCEICEKVYGCRKYLLEHKRNLHTISVKRKKVYTCETCGKTLSGPLILEAHKKLHLSSEERKTAFFKCPYCELQYPLKTTMLAHVRLQHNKEKPLCEICGKKFGNRWSLKLHRATHYADEKRYYECQICDKKLTTKASLKTHCEKVHRSDRYTTPRKKREPTLNFEIRKRPVEEKKHECYECGNKYLTPGYLKLHYKRAHGDNRKYSCEVCGKEFTMPEYLKLHQKVHLTVEEKKKSEIKCPHCDSKFPRRQSMIRHVRIIHLKERLKCKTCDKAYTTKQNLRSHEEKCVPTKATKTPH